MDAVEFIAIAEALGADSLKLLRHFAREENRNSLKSDRSPSSQKDSSHRGREDVGAGGFLSHSSAS